jgi:protein-tyrosine-phosphatase
VTTVLFVCTGNQCRSPMAEALLRSKFAERSSLFEVQSAGFISEGTAPPPEVLEVMRAVGIELTGHRSQKVNAKLIESAELVIGMARQHLIDLALIASRDWDRCFTFVDLLRRAETVGPRAYGESVSGWGKRAHAGRERAQILAASLEDDIPDPMGGRLREFRSTLEMLSELTSRLADYLAPA